MAISLCLDQAKRHNIDDELHCEDDGRDIVHSGGYEIREERLILHQGNRAHCKQSERSGRSARTKGNAFKQCMCTERNPYLRQVAVRRSDEHHEAVDHDGDQNNSLEDFVGRDEDTQQTKLVFWPKEEHRSVIRFVSTLTPPAHLLLRGKFTFQNMARNSWSVLRLLPIR